MGVMGSSTMQVMFDWLHIFCLHGNGIVTGLSHAQRVLTVVYYKLN
jgi:hypothetical protein